MLASSMLKNCDVLQGQTKTLRKLQTMTHPISNIRPHSSFSLLWVFTTDYKLNIIESEREFEQVS